MNEQAPPRTGRIYLAVIAGLVLIFAVLTAYFWWTRDRFVAEPDLYQELQESTLIDPPPAETAADWPQWLGPRRDGVSPETGLMTDWPADGLKTLWEAKIKADAGSGYSGLAVSDGRVITLVQQDPPKDFPRDQMIECVLCWQADTGKELWRLPYTCPKFMSSFGSGPRATPTVVGNRVYTVGASGACLCLEFDEQNQVRQVWRRDLLDNPKETAPTWGVCGSLLVVGDLVYANPGHPAGGSLVALNRDSGDVVTKALDDPAGYSSPVAITVASRERERPESRQVVCFMGNSVVGVEPGTLKLLWRYPWETDHGANVATPLHFQAKHGEAVNDYVFVSSGYGKGCALLKLVKQEDGTFEAQRVYEGNQMGNRFATTVRYRDHFYGFNDTVLTCLDIKSGQVRWTQKGFGKGSLIVADGHLLILGENGKLAMAVATPKGYWQQAEHQVFQKKCWTVPSLADGRLYVRDEERVLCLQLARESK